MITRGSSSPNGGLFLDAGVLASSVDAFAASLVARGHTALVVGDYARAARHFGHWLAYQSITPEAIDDRVLVRFAAHRCRCPGGRRLGRISRSYAARAKRFVEFLQDRGEVAHSICRRADSVSPRLAAFRHHLLHERGVVPATAAKHLRLIGRVLPQMGDDPARYSARTVRDAALASVGAASCADAKTVVTALRVYLRFLASRGECRAGLEHSIPRVPQWRLSALPRPFNAILCHGVVSARRANAGICSFR